MGTKSPNPARYCACSLCGNVAVSIPGTKHRRCGGKADASRLPRHTWAKNAGKWQAA